MKYLSASSLTEYLKCPRSAILTALGLRSPGTKAQERGTRLHSALEDYLTGRTETVEDSLGDIARTSGFLPLPGPDIHVEKGIGPRSDDAQRYADTETWTDLPTSIAGVPFRGIVDLVRLDRGALEIWDHKTTSSWRWAETAESLRQNLQIWAYAEHMARWLEHTGDMPDAPITMGHIQYLKVKNPKAHHVRASATFQATRGEVAHRWHMIERIAESFIKDYQKALRHVRPDRSHCRAYGGCKKKEMCDAILPRGLDIESQSVVLSWKLSH